MCTVKKGIRNIPIAGIQPMTTIDFPGKIAGVLFTQGCSWQCRYCQNPSLRNIDSTTILPTDSVLEFLESRAGFLEGIVISGGEPTIHSSLPHLLEYIKNLGYAVALHTNGYFSDMLSCILKRGLVDYIALDIKAPPHAYDRITQVKNSCFSVAKSIKAILSSGVDYEFRTTYHPSIISEQELVSTITAVHGVGAKRYYIQRFQRQGVVDPELSGDSRIVVIPEIAVLKAQRFFEVFEVR
jgi:pyruvate formate lyase activating enzyme